MGNPFVHIELNTGDQDAARKFYKKLFDWKLTDMQMPVGVYTSVDVGQGTGGGIQQKMMPEAPTAWLPYVQVDDVKKCVAKARKLGAQILEDSMDIGDIGTIGLFLDPTGAMLGVWAPKPPAKKAAPKKAAAKKPARQAKAKK